MQILNPTWNTFVNEVVVAQIKKEMFIECSFTPSLYKLLLYKTGSFFKPHRDSEKEDGMFATLTIQLPSQYKGGQLIVRHDGKTRTSDFSSYDSSNAFSTFFNAFYCDCEHEVLKVTEGYRMCLVYNLISDRSEIPKAPRRNDLEVQLKTLIENWEYQGKLVYALKHKYSEANLSFDNLKTTDRVVANFLVYMSKAYDLHVFLAVFNKESSGQAEACDFDFDRRYRSRYGESRSDVDADFDSSDDDFSTGKSYNVKKLISVDADNILSTTSLNVDFDNEVVPEDCFENIEPYRKTAEPTGNAGVDVNKYYRSAAIVFWPKGYLLQVLKKGGARSVDLDKVFLKEVEDCRGKVKDEKTKTKLTIWANEVVSSGGGKPIDVIKAIIEMKDVQLIQKLFSRSVHLNEVSNSLLIDVCERYGWNTFSTQIPGMFQKLSKEIAIQLLGQLIGNIKVENEKKSIVHNVLALILKKCKNVNPSYSTWYVRPPTMEEKMKKRSEDQDFLLSACHLAEKIAFNMLSFMKTKSFEVLVPVLFRLVPKGSITLNPFWKEIALYFLHEMEKEAAKPAMVPNWRRNDKITCTCSDCNTLNAFLASDQQTISLKIGKQRRRHLHEGMNRMQDLAHETDRGGHIGILVITKTNKTGMDDLEKRTFSKEQMAKFRAIIPS